MTTYIVETTKSIKLTTDSSEYPSESVFTVGQWLDEVYEEEISNPERVFREVFGGLDAPIRRLNEIYAEVVAYCTK